MKTKRGIYHNIKDSEYVHTIGETKFYFSSRFYRDKFVATYIGEMKRFNQSLNNVYKDHFQLFAGWLACIRLYSQIEKRGFYIVLNGVDITCLEDLVFDVIPSYKTKLDDLINSSKTNNQGYVPKKG